MKRLLLALTFISSSLLIAKEQTPYFQSTQEIIEWVNLEKLIDLAEENNREAWFIENFDKHCEINIALFLLKQKEESNFELLETVPYKNRIKLLARMPFNDFLDLHIYNEARESKFYQLQQFVVNRNPVVQQIVKAIEKEEYTFSNITFAKNTSTENQPCFSSTEDTKTWAAQAKGSLENATEKEWEQFLLKNYDRLKEWAIVTSSYFDEHVDSLLTKPYIKSHNLIKYLTIESTFQWIDYIQADKHNYHGIKKFIEERCPAIRPLIDLHKKTEKSGK
ncbi:hypothetical protein HOK96_01255 [bacterium]|jgi:hypothetical protein|nr:hypothetical protein [bacterium]